MKKLLTQAFAMLLICIIGLAALPVHGADDQARVFSFSGQVIVNDKPAQKGQLVKDGDRVVTGPDSRCSIVFEKKNVIRIWADTDMTLALNTREKKVKLVSGTFATVAKKVTSWWSRMVNPDTPYYTVSTPTAICGVRGTAFFIKVEDPQTSYVCLCNGRMEVSQQYGSDIRDLEAVHHNPLRVTGAAGKATTVKATMEFHTDPEMESVAAAGGETIDWSKID